MMIKNHFDAAWGDQMNPNNEYMLEELSPSGQLTVRVCTAADRNLVYAAYNLTHYVVAADLIVRMPQLKLMHK